METPVSGFLRHTFPTEAFPVQFLDDFISDHWRWALETFALNWYVLGNANDLDSDTVTTPRNFTCSTMHGETGIVTVVCGAVHNQHPSSANGVWCNTGDMHPQMAALSYSIVELIFHEKYPEKCRDKYSDVSRKSLETQRSTRIGRYYAGVVNPNASRPRRVDANKIRTRQSRTFVSITARPARKPATGDAATVGAGRDGRGSSPGPEIIRGDWGRDASRGSVASDAPEDSRYKQIDKQRSDPIRVSFFLEPSLSFDTFIKGKCYPLYTNGHPTALQSRFRLSDEFGVAISGRANGTWSHAGANSAAAQKWAGSTKNVSHINDIATESLNIDRMDSNGLETSRSMRLALIYAPGNAVPVSRLRRADPVGLRKLSLSGSNSFTNVSLLSAISGAFIFDTANSDVDVNMSNQQRSDLVVVGPR
ncbi:hypothetical protein EVAR_31903_1 [Eumeta japonica]|uniref:Uncharacterized protein n=1 Tax=Eumeta variegata TaxID=151549 RepID=A0A4C1XLZ3_EUMVA|nr:hypothetical protein EVAR_31903_1 [Eumeta japonica]